MRELLIASRHRFERVIKSRQPLQPIQTAGKSLFSSKVESRDHSLTISLDVICTQDSKSKQLQETLVHAQEALVIQILLDVLHQYKQVESCESLYERTDRADF